MGASQGFCDLVVAGLAEEFVRTPAACCKALGFEEVEAILRGAKMHRAAANEPGLHRRAEGVDVAVGVEIAENVFAAAKRFEPGVEEVVVSHLAIP